MKPPVRRRSSQESRFTYLVDAVGHRSYNLVNLPTMFEDTSKEVRNLATETGKRYSCENCGAEFVVTRGSEEGGINCCGTAMNKKT